MNGWYFVDALFIDCLLTVNIDSLQYPFAILTEDASEQITVLMQKLAPQTIEEDDEEQKALATQQEWKINMETELGVQPGTIPA